MIFLLNFRRLNHTKVQYVTHSIRVGLGMLNFSSLLKIVRGGAPIRININSIFCLYFGMEKSKTSLLYHTHTETH